MCSLRAWLTDAGLRFAKAAQKVQNSKSVLTRIQSWKSDSQHSVSCLHYLNSPIKSTNQCTNVNPRFQNLPWAFVIKIQFSVVHHECPKRGQSALHGEAGAVQKSGRAAAHHHGTALVHLQWGRWPDRVFAEGCSSALHLRLSRSRRCSQAADTNSALPATACAQGLNTLLHYQLLGRLRRVGWRIQAALLSQAHPSAHATARTAPDAHCRFHAHWPQSPIQV